LKEAESLKIDSFDIVDKLVLERIVVKASTSLHLDAQLHDALVETVSSREIKL